ncbi:hypothetical protein GME_16505 [Halomonas sp. TD01]|nr:hypothetical protein GME_16505 [Halomonas sp. TD01]
MWVYIPVWIFFFVMALGSVVGASITLRGAAAQIEMNDRQKADATGVSEQQPPVVTEKQGTPVGAQKLKRRGDVPSAPPPSDNWPR